jgi:hypothetical protein
VGDCIELLTPLEAALTLVIAGGSRRTQGVREGALKPAHHTAVEPWGPRRGHVFLQATENEQAEHPFAYRSTGPVLGAGNVTAVSQN